MSSTTVTFAAAGPINGLVPPAAALLCWIPYRARANALAREQRPVPGWRQACYAAGLVVLAIALSYPVDNLVLAIKKRAPEAEVVSSAARRRESQTRLKLPTMRQERVWLAVHRLDDSVYYRRIDRETFLLLSALSSGATISNAVALPFEKTRLNAEEHANLLRESFALASELGWFCFPYAADCSEALVM